MAKGNMLLGYSRGSVGDVTFYRAGGSQRQRARNRQPNNPRTAKQMTQRSKFANAVKFFKQINTGFYKYAFEDRKTNESDYNAFMRHNVVNSGYIGAQASKIADWPALGLWQLSAGSLPEIVAPFPQPHGASASMYFYLGVTITAEYETIGQLSAALINGAPSIWRAGDIFTFVVYRATIANTLPTVDTSEDHKVYADYGQFILNPDDTTALTDIKSNIGICNVVPSTDAGGFYLTGDAGDMVDVWENDLVGYSVIHSRNGANGLLVSSSTMVYNKRELPLLAMTATGPYYSAVIADWQASADAILQGAAAEVVAEVVGWSDSASGPYNKTADDVTLTSAEPVTATVYVKYASAAAAAAGVSLINGSGNNGGIITLTKTVNGDLVTVSYTATLSQASSTAQVRVGTEVAVSIRRTT